MPRLTPFPVALNLLERNSHGLCLGLSFPHLWKAGTGASLEGAYTRSAPAAPPCATSRQASVPRGSPGSEPGFPCLATALLDGPGEGGRNSGQGQPAIAGLWSLTPPGP